MRASAMLRAAALASTLAALAGAVASCAGPRAPTEMIIEVDADEGVRARAASVRIEVFGRAATGAFTPTPMHDLPYEVPLPTGRWGPTVVLFPEERDATRFYRVRAIALDDAGAEITRVQLVSGYVSGVSLRFRLFLQASCEGVTCDAEDETCRDGGCVPAFVDPRTLLDGGLPVDAGGSMDAGPPDAPTPDGGPMCTDCDDGMACTRDRCVDGVCENLVECDDGIACTTDACGGDGTCVHMPVDAMCTGGPSCGVGSCDPTLGCSYTLLNSMCDDSMPCTDDVCTATGCTHTDVPVDTSCPQNGSFCDGIERCNGTGDCVSPGDPCVAPTTCSEAMDRCTGCTSSAQCPGDTTSMGTCDYADGCDESASRTDTVNDWECTGGSCVLTPRPVDVPCTRDTELASCGTRTCGTPECGGFATECATSGTFTTPCTDFECRAGTCTAFSDPSTGGACTRDTTGNACGAAACGGQYCSWADPFCSESGTWQADCTAFYCAAGACAPMPYVEPDPSGDRNCDRTTDGLSCGLCFECGSGTCSVPLCGGEDAGPPDAGRDAGPPDAGRDAGSDAAVPGDAGRDAGVDSGTGTIVPDGGSCGAAPCCTNPALCVSPTPFCCPGAGSTPNGCNANPCVG